MEKILEEINNEIRKVAQSEEIDIQKLTGLINTRDRLKSYTTVSVAQIQEFNGSIRPTFPAFRNMATENSIFDSMRDLAEIYSKSLTEHLKNKNDTNIHDLIFYHNFISKLEPSRDTLSSINHDRLETQNNIELLIMKELKSLINKENNKEKVKILDITTEIKNIEKPLEAQT